MRPLKKILQDLHTHLARPTDSKKLAELITEFDQKCCAESTIKKLQKNEAKLNDVRIINAKIIEVYANTVSAITSKVFAQLNLEEIKTWPKADSFAQLVDVWNCYTLFLVNNILDTKELELRNLRIERWIAVAKKLHKEQDFFSAHAFYSSLIKSEVERLYKYAANGISIDALRRLSELSTIYDVPTKRFFERHVLPAQGPKLSNVYAMIEASKANLEGQSTIKDRNDHADVIISDEFCITEARKMFNDYDAKIVAHKILAQLNQEILQFMPQSRIQRKLKDLRTKRVKLQTAKALIAGENSKNPTNENANIIAHIDVEIAKTQKSIEEAQVEVAFNNKEIQQKTMFIKPRNKELPGSNLAAKLGSLIPGSPALPTAAPTISKNESIPLTRSRSQSTSMANVRPLRIDLHGSSISPARRPYNRTRGRSNSVSSMDFSPVRVSSVDISIFRLPAQEYPRSSSSLRVNPKEKNIVRGSSSIKGIKP